MRRSLFFVFCVSFFMGATAHAKECESFGEAFAGEFLLGGGGACGAL